VAVGFYDARNSIGNNTVEYFVTVSTDGGASFLPNVQVSTGLSDGTEDNIGDPNEFGDFYTIDFFNNVIRPVWADNSSTLPGNPDPPSLEIASAAVTFVPDNGGGPPIVLSGTMVVGEDTGGAPIGRGIGLGRRGVVREFAPFDLALRG